MWSSALPGLVVGVVVAIITVLLTEQAFLNRRSNLVEVGIVLNPQQSQYVWRLQLVNKGRYPARNVRADVERLLSESSQRTIVVSPLNWAHNPGDIYTRDIFPNQTAYLDICVAYITPCYDPEHFKLSNNLVHTIDESSSIYKGETRVDIGLYQESGQRVKIELKIDWDGSYQKESLEGVEVSILRFEEFRS